MISDNEVLDAPQRPATKSAFVYSQIREAILTGKLLPDQRLRLTELAAKYKLSPMPVREALRMLQRDGLITMEDHRGATVAHLSWRRAAEFVEVRTLLEVHAALKALPNHGDKSIRVLRTIVETMKKPEVMADSDKFTRLNRDFHIELYRPGPNSVLKQEIDDLWDHVWRVRKLSIFSIDRTRVGGANEEHERIVDAVSNGDAMTLELAMAYHRELTLRTWNRIVDESEIQQEKIENE